MFTSARQCASSAPYGVLEYLTLRVARVARAQDGTKNQKKVQADPSSLVYRQLYIVPTLQRTIHGQTNGIQTDFVFGIVSTAEHRQEGRQFGLRQK